MESREEKHIQAHFLLMFSFFSSLWFIYCTFNQPSWFREMLKDSSSILLSPCQPPEEYLAVFRIPPAVGLVNVKLWGSVLDSAPSLTPCSCLCCASSRAWHSCANLSTAQTPRAGSVSTASGGHTSGWSCLDSPWQLYFSCRQGCWGGSAARGFIHPCVWEGESAPISQCSA